MAKSKYLTRNEILNADDLKQEEVEVPEWGGNILVREMGAKSRFEFLNSPDDLPAIPMMASLCIVDEEGNRLFSMDDMEALGKKSPVALHRVYKVALRINGLEAGSPEEATEGFLADQTEDLPSD